MKPEPNQSPEPTEGLRPSAAHLYRSAEEPYMRLFRRPIVARLAYNVLFAALIVIFGYVNRYQWEERKVSAIVYAGLAIGAVGIAAGAIRLWLDLKDPVRRELLLKPIDEKKPIQPSETTRGK